MSWTATAYLVLAQTTRSNGTWLFVIVMAVAAYLLFRAIRRGSSPQTSGTCARCQSSYPSHAKFCPKCGQAVG